MYEIIIEKKIKEITGLKSIKLSTPPPNIKGDISTNAAMVCGIDAENISAELMKLDVVKNSYVIGPGFVNMEINKNAFSDEVKEIVLHPNNYGCLSKKGTIIFEMVSSNPTGPLHIGHGRGAAIGDSLSKIYEYLGYEVFREYYVNDTGKQMKLLGESIFNSKTGRQAPENGYKGKYIKELANQFEEYKTSQECAKNAAGIILKEHFAVLKEFGVLFDNVFYESSLHQQNKVEKTINKLTQKGLTYKKEGALWFKSSKFDDDMDRVLRKKDGELTYFAADCAYHKDKAERVPNLLNIWGADHHGYIPRIKAFWETMGYGSAKKLDILLYQLVELKRGKEKISMSTRGGEFITLKEVIDEVGKDAARFMLLMRSADASLEFDLKLAKKLNKDNPVYYVQYSHARICSIFKKAGRDFYSLNIKAVTELCFDKKTEKDLIKKLSHFPYLLNKCVELNTPHLLTEYLRETATVFHKYYDTVRVIDSPQQEARLLLMKAVKNIIKNGLNLLGVSAPTAM